MRAATRILPVASFAILLGVVARRGPAPERLIVDADTLVINGPRAVAAPIRGVAADGRTTSRSRLSWSGTSNVARVSPAGEVTCRHKGNALVTGSSGALSARVVVLCRPIAGFAFSSGFGDRVLVGGPPQAFLIAAYDSDKAPVPLSHASALIDDSAVARIDSGLLRGVSLGVTQMSLDFDGISWRRKLEVDEKVVQDTLRFVGGQIKTYRVAPGGWYDIQLYRADSADHGAGLAVGSFGANCAHSSSGGLHYYCIAGTGAAIVVQNTLASGPHTERLGVLTIFRKPREGQPPEVGK